MYATVVQTKLVYSCTMHLQIVAVIYKMYTKKKKKAVLGGMANNKSLYMMRLNLLLLLSLFGINSKNV